MAAFVILEVLHGLLNEVVSYNMFTLQLSAASSERKLQCDLLITSSNSDLLTRKQMNPGVWYLDNSVLILMK